MTTAEANKLLEQFRAGTVPREKVLRAFQSAPVADLGFAQVDTHRALRKNFPEVIFGSGKTPEHNLEVMRHLPELRAKVHELLKRTGVRPGHIFNLGHGILPETPVENVKAVVEMVREFRP